MIRATSRSLLAAVTVTIALAALPPTPVSAQCAMCRTLLRTPEGQQLVSGFRRGIVLLLAAPFLAFGAVAVLAVRSQRRTSQIRDDADNLP